MGIVGANEKEIWTKWMLPEYPRGIVVENAAELNLL